MGTTEFLESLHISFAKGGALRAEQFNRILSRVKGQDVEKLIERTPRSHRLVLVQGNGRFVG